MVDGTDGALHRRRLTQRLRRGRIARGLTQAQVARTLDWSESKVLRVEQGRSSVSTTDLKAMLQLYGITDDELIDEFVETARRSKRPSWTREYSDVITPSYRSYVGYEISSSRLCSFEPTYVPGQLQTEAYARAIMSVYSRPDTELQEIERRVQFRMARQRYLLAHDAPEMTFIIEEAALRRRVGVRTHGSALMRDQLRKILALRRRPNITVQMLPLAAGEHPGMSLGSFVHLRFSDPRDRDLVFRENATGDATDLIAIEKAWPYEKAFLKLQELALGPDASHAAIHAILLDLHGHDP